MDRLGIRLAVLSLPAGLPAGPVGHENRASAREFNILSSQIRANHPVRFDFFACMPNLLDTQGKRASFFFREGPSPAERKRDDTGSLHETEFALDELEACGIALSSSYGEGAEASGCAVLGEAPVADFSTFPRVHWRRCIRPSLGRTG